MPRLFAAALLTLNKQRRRQLLVSPSLSAALAGMFSFWMRHIILLNET